MVCRVASDCVISPLLYSLCIAAPSAAWTNARSCPLSPVRLPPLLDSSFPLLLSLTCIPSSPVGPSHSDRVRRCSGVSSALLIGWCSASCCSSSWHMHTNRRSDIWELESIPKARELVSLLDDRPFWCQSTRAATGQGHLQSRQEWAT